MQKIHQVFAVIAAFALISGVSAGDYTEEEKVLVLGDNSLDAALKEFEHVLVEFYAPWCGHCKKLAPEYARAASVLAEQGAAVKLAKVDCTVEKAVAEKYEIKGYPTLKFFIGGKPVEYEGGRTEKDIVNWLNKKTLPSTREVTTSEQLAKETKDNDVLVVFFGGSDDEAYKTFDTVSKNFDDVGFVYTSSADLKTEQNVAEGTRVLLLKKFDEGRNEYSGSLTSDGIKNFIDQNRFPLVLPFDQKAAQKIFGDSIPTMFLIYKKNEEGERAEAVFREAASKLKGKIQLSISDINDGGLGPRLAEFVGVKESETPAIRIVHPQRSSAPKKYLFNSEVNVENLEQFYNDYSAGKLKLFLKSEPVPEDNSAPVKVVVGVNFDEIVLNPEKDVFIEFYAPWCGHCKKLVPIWDELAEELKEYDNIVIAKMDSTANEVESVSVSGFPTLKFYPKGSNKAAVSYEGERTKEGFINYLREKNAIPAKAAGKGDEL